jgi:hypothetical protein
VGIAVVEVAPRVETEVGGAAERVGPDDGARDGLCAVDTIGVASNRGDAGR